MKKIAYSAMLGMLLFSCSKSDVNSVLNESATSTPAATQQSGREGDFDCVPATKTVSLLAGQTANAGDVTVSNDGVNLSVTYTTTGNWKISEIHLYVGEYVNAPQNNGGNPTPGRFPYKQTFSTGVTTYTQVISLATLPECFVVAAHAVVKNGTSGTETGWGQGTQFPGNNWGMYFDYCKQDCPL